MRNISFNIIPKKISSFLGISKWVLIAFYNLFGITCRVSKSVIIAGSCQPTCRSSFTLQPIKLVSCLGICPGTCALKITRSCRIFKTFKWYLKLIRSFRISQFQESLLFLCTQVLFQIIYFGSCHRAELKLWHRPLQCLQHIQTQLYPQTQPIKYFHIPLNIIQIWAEFLKVIDLILIFFINKHPYLTW